MCKHKDDNMMLALIGDVAQSVQDVKPQVYHKYGGKKKMKMRARGNMHQMSNQVQYRNNAQTEMVSYNRSWKA